MDQNHEFFKNIMDNDKISGMINDYVMREIVLVILLVLLLAVRLFMSTSVKQSATHTDNRIVATQHERSVPTVNVNPYRSQTQKTPIRTADVILSELTRTQALRVCSCLLTVALFDGPIGEDDNNFLSNVNRFLGVTILDINNDIDSNKSTLSDEVEGNHYIISVLQSLSVEQKEWFVTALDKLIYFGGEKSSDAKQKYGLMLIKLIGIDPSHFGEIMEKIERMEELQEQFWTNFASSRR